MESMPIHNLEILELFRSSIPTFWYLEERSWFMRNPELQLKLLIVIRLGLGSQVITCMGDFSEHLDHLIGLHSQRIRNELDGLTGANITFRQLSQ